MGARVSVGDGDGDDARVWSEEHCTFEPKNKVNRSLTRHTHASLDHKTTTSVVRLNLPRGYMHTYPGGSDPMLTRVVAIPVGD